MNDKTALLLVDIQPDFMPGGTLAVAGGDEILDPVRELIASPRFELHVATQDWHPADHISFASRHEGKKPFDMIDLYGKEQVVWPDHCVQGTRGATLHPDLSWDSVAAIIRKGMDPQVDSYSGFKNNWNRGGRRPETGLAGYLRERGIGNVFLCGLARDFCVKWSAEDAVGAGFRVTVVWDATRPVDPASDDRVRSDLERIGVHIALSGELF